MGRVTVRAIVQEEEDKMFHITKKVYLEYDYAFTSKYPNYLVASSTYAARPMVTLDDLAAPLQAPTFEELLSADFNNDIEEFWQTLLTKETKFIAYLDVDTLTKLQIQYWKSIFTSDFGAAQAHMLYTSWVESLQLWGYYKPIGSFDAVSGEWSRPNAFSIPSKTLEEITEIFNETSVSTTLQNLDNNEVSIEYLMADYFYNNETPNSVELFERIKTLTWDNWLDELAHLRYEILSGTIDAQNLDTNLDITIGNIQEQLALSPSLSWTVDPKFGEDVDYIRNTYNYTIFDPLWNGLAEIWGCEYDDMVEVNRMINEDDYPGLLTRDINRNYGSSYTRTRFMGKCNQVFTTWLYRQVRNSNTNDLAPFRLA
jgi:hypothetical protein